MALDESEHRLMIVTRTPPRLVVYDTSSGKVVTTQPCVADVDDLYYDANHKRVYIPGGQGFIDVFQQKDADHYERIARIATVIGCPSPKIKTPHESTSPMFREAVDSVSI